VERVLSGTQRRAHVVTFNYDTLIEATVDALKFLTYRRVGPLVMPTWAVPYGGAPAAPAETFTYCKLHGSVHWYWDPSTRSAESMVDIGLPATWGSGRDTDRDPHLRAPGKEPVIIPPVLVKTSFFVNPVVRYLWRTAFQGLRAASRVFVLGYSLPAADLLVRGMLTDSIRDTEIWLVDRDESIRNRFD
jgi:hypothetical protein